jgi:tetratricopeptide (TPR) repeat protein
MRNAGDYVAAESLYRLSARMDTLYDFPVSNLSGMQIQLGQRAAVDSTFRMLFRRLSPGAATNSQLLYRFIQGDTAGVIESARRGYDSTATDPDQRLTYANMARFLHALRGELREADQWRRRCIETAKTLGRGSREMAYRLTYAEHLALGVGDSARAARLIDSVVANVFPRFDALERPYASLVTAYVAVGRVDKAKAALNDLKKNVGDGDALDPQIRIPRARIALAEKRWDDALRDVSTAVRIQDGYLLRGIAYAGRGDRDSAIVYFERYANMLDPDHIYTPLVLRRLGELNAEKGDRSRALDWYRKFVGLWRHADAELQPQVSEVKRRIAELEALEARER